MVMSVLLDGAAVSLSVAARQYFVYRQSMNVDAASEAKASDIAAAVGEPARARMLYSLLDGHARTGTELAIVAQVSPSTASVHLARLVARGLLGVVAQGRHRYYRLGGINVAAMLESLLVVAGGERSAHVSAAPSRLRAARTCYDHMAGTVAVSIHDRFRACGWLSACAGGKDYLLSAGGEAVLAELGLDVGSLRMMRRRFACACLDWSERRPHIGGAVGAALLRIALKRRWVTQDLDSRALRLTRVGTREMHARFGMGIPAG
jgi:DNA-binding transcriptional ArsR family regulator